MQDLQLLWRETEERFDRLEKSLVDCYLGFLREVAKAYLQEGRRVFFRENRVVHWGEWNFGTLVIEGEEEVYEVFGDYISEISFEPELNEKNLKGYVEIRMGNIQDIRYGH